MEIVNILDSDQHILDRTIRTAEKDSTLLRFEFEDGPFLGEMPEKLDAKILSEWCNAVRREYSARLNRKETKKDSEAATLRRAQDEAVALSRGSAGRGDTVPENATDAKASMEAEIEAKLAHLGGRGTILAQELSKLEGHRLNLVKQLNSVEAAARFYTTMKEKMNEQGNSGNAEERERVASSVPRVPTRPLADGDVE